MASSVAAELETLCAERIKSKRRALESLNPVVPRSRAAQQAVTPRFTLAGV